MIYLSNFHKTYYFLVVFLVIFNISCKEKKQAVTKPIDFVNPFIGTGAHGHIYPGATTPFGMIQWSPGNGVGGWDWCSGYHYSSDRIAGFSHLHPISQRKRNSIKQKLYNTSRNNSGRVASTTNWQSTE